MHQSDLYRTVSTEYLYEGDGGVGVGRLGAGMVGSAVLACTEDTGFVHTACVCRGSGKASQ